MKNIILLKGWKITHLNLISDQTWNSDPPWCKYANEEICKDTLAKETCIISCRKFEGEYLYALISKCCIIWTYMNIIYSIINKTIFRTYHRLYITTKPWHFNPSNYWCYGVKIFRAVSQGWMDWYHWPGATNDRSPPQICDDAYISAIFAKSAFDGGKNIPGSTWSYKL